MNEQTHLVVGPGALGRLVALHLAGVAPVTVAGRRALPATQMLVTPEGMRRPVPLDMTTLAELPPLAPAYLHLTTKAYDAQAAYESAMARLTGTPILVLWQNGYQVQPELQRRHPGPVLCASTTEGAWLTGDEGVTHAGRGITYLGDLTGRHTECGRQLAATLNRAGLAAEAVTDIETRLWHKLAINAAINPRGARYRVRNGQLRDRPFRPMVERVVDEVAAVMAKVGASPPPGGWHAMVWQVIEGTANNRASMLQDVLAGRPTERDAILGPLLAAAHEHGLDTPCLEDLDGYLASVSVTLR